MPDLDAIEPCQCGVSDWRWTGVVRYSSPPEYEARCVACGALTYVEFREEGPLTVDEMGWHWKLNEGCLDLCDRDDRRLAFIKERPHYCDRGHFQVVIELGGLNLEPIDGRDLMYYMDLDVAMWETIEFLYWRICKVSHHQPRGFGSIERWAKDNWDGATEMEVTSLEYKSTAWYTTPSARNQARADRVLKRTGRPLPYTKLLRVPEDRQEIENQVADSCGVPRRMMDDKTECVEPRDQDLEDA